MLRDKNLIPLSHQHQHALALCVRMDRAMQAGDANLEPWQQEIQQIVEQEIAIHFEAEEKVIFPAAARFAELKPLVEELLREHVELRKSFARAAARELDHAGLRALAGELAAHIRKEERELFEGMQQQVAADEMVAVGEALEKELRRATHLCTLKNTAPSSESSKSQ